MKLLHNWRRVLLCAWSSRLIVLAAALSGLEVVLPLFAAAMPAGWFAIASFAATAAALVARVVAQPSIHQGESDGKQ